MCVRPALSLAIAAVVGAVALVGAAFGDLENQVFSSKSDRLRLVVPRAFRASDQANYPGLVLWMLSKAHPDTRMVLTAEPFTRALYCSWPIACRASRDSLPRKAACALRARLSAQRLATHDVQAGPKDNEEVGIPSVWFEYEDRTHYLRHAITVTDDRVVSLLLSAPTNELRGANVRPFEQALRTLRPMTADELGATASTTAAPAAPSDAGTSEPMIADAGAAGLPSFESAPAAAISPVGPCGP